MLIEFGFGNFRSFKDIQSLNMTAAKISSKNKELDENNVFQAGKYDLLKSKAIYGANASGKSNVVKAFEAFKFIVEHSVGNKNVLKEIEPFALATETENAPSFFQIIFSAEGTVYRYGFEASRERVHSEWLFGTPGQREVPFFVREGNNIVEINKNQFKEGVKILSLFDNEEEDNQPYRTDSLFLSTVNSLNGKLSNKISVYMFRAILSSSSYGEETLHNITLEYLQNFAENYDEKINNFLKYIGLGFERAEVIKISDEGKMNPTVISKHKKYNAENKQIGLTAFDFLKNESEGSQKLLGLSVILIISLEVGGVLLIDEIDAKLHPILTQKIVELFNSKENKNGAQLVFVTHDTNLLSANLLRRDQIEFTEKDKYGASHLYPLVQFKGLRDSDAFEKDYIRGKYGAIPFVGNLKEILFNQEADA